MLLFLTFSFPFTRVVTVLQLLNEREVRSQRQKYTIKPFQSATKSFIKLNSLLNKFWNQYNCINIITRLIFYLVKNCIFLEIKFSIDQIIAGKL